MSNITIKPFTPNGSITAPPSKSDVHRAIICASLAKGKSIVSPVAFSQDILATIDCARSLGAEVAVNENSLTIDGTNTFRTKTAELNCRESGSTLRFMIPTAAAGGVSAVFSGKGRLPQRPMNVYTELLPKHGVECVSGRSSGTSNTSEVSYESAACTNQEHAQGKCKDSLRQCFSVKGKLTAGRFDVPGDISSQFITGLMFALPLLEGDSVIHLTSPLQSKGYIDMTLGVMARFGVNIERDGDDYLIRGGQEYTPQSYVCEGDWSQAAFFLTMGALGGEVTVHGLRSNSVQGDKEIVKLLERFGADVSTNADSVTCRKGKLAGIDIDASQIPDLVPILTVCACFAKGQTRIYNAQRVRLKESDRLAAISDALNSCGADISQTADGLIINGKESIAGGFANGCNDHRIVMSMAAAAARSGRGITVSDKESIAKSYENFFEDLAKVGGVGN